MLDMLYTTSLGLSRPMVQRRCKAGFRLLKRSVALGELRAVGSIIKIPTLLSGGGLRSEKPKPAPKLQ